MFVLRFAYADLLYIFIPIIILLVLYRFFLYRSPLYRFPLTQLLVQQNLTKKSYYKPILFVLRLASLIGLMLLVLRPQWVDERSKVNVEGRDIMLVIDVSGSMQCFDDPKDQRQRIEVAKTEAIRFVEKRIDDPIGIVIFGKETVSRCPLTLDKQILKEIIGGIELGMIDPDGTSLGSGLATAVNRLRTSKAKSKVIILLTDGNPTEDKVDPMFAAEMAQKFGIKVYTIGIGNEEGSYAPHPLLGIVGVRNSLNVKLLQSIAEQTGGMFFRANNPKEMRKIYDKIDALEKTVYQTNIYHRAYEAFLTFIWFVLAILASELLLRLFVWRGV